MAIGKIGAGLAAVILGFVVAYAPPVQAQGVTSPDTEPSSQGAGEKGAKPPSFAEGSASTLGHLRPDGKTPTKPRDSSGPNSPSSQQAH